MPDNFSDRSLTKENVPAAPPLRYPEKTMFQRVVKRFLRSEGGQGLAEYCLISALLAILGLGIYLVAGGGKNLAADDSANVQTSGAQR